MAYENSTTDERGPYLPPGSGGSLAGRPLDPKALAASLASGETVYFTARCLPNPEGQRDLIIAALRAYEPHVHKWGGWKDRGTMVIPRYDRTCPTCHVSETARDLVPVKDGP